MREYTIKTSDFVEINWYEYHIDYALFTDNMIIENCSGFDGCNAKIVIDELKNSDNDYIDNVEISKEINKYRNNPDYSVYALYKEQCLVGYAKIEEYNK